MKKTIEVFIHQNIAGYRKGDLVAYSFDGTIYSNEGDSALRLICKKEIEVDVPDDNLDLMEIEVLEAQITKEKGESQGRVNLLLERISKLKAIGHEVAS